MSKQEIIECLDLDEWKHSWHNKLKTLQDLKTAYSVLDEKVTQRLSDITKLRLAISDLSGMIVSLEGEGCQWVKLKDNLWISECEHHMPYTKSTPFCCGCGKRVEVAS